MPSSTCENPERGGAAIMSAMIISLLLLVITASLGFSAFFGATDLVDSENKLQSLALAGSCLDMARLEIIRDRNYQIPAGGYVMAMGEGWCSIISFGSSRSFPITIQVQGVYRKAFTNLEAVMAQDGSITSLEEIPSLPP